MLLGSALIAMAVVMAFSGSAVLAADVEPPVVQWQAQRIWSDGRGTDVRFRRHIDVPEDLETAYFAGSCDQQYELLINGQKVGGAHRWDYIDVCRLTLFLRPGPNVLAVRARHSGGNGSLGGQVVLRTRDGRTTTIPTDGRWRCSDGEEPGWMLPGFDDGGWAAAREQGAFPDSGPWGSRGIRQPERPDLEYAHVVVYPEAVNTPLPGGGELRDADSLLAPEGACTVRAAPGRQPPQFVVDFGRQVVGYPAIAFRTLPAGAQIEIQYGQSMREVLTAPVCGLQGVDFVTMDPGEAVRWVSPLVKGFRYARFIVHRADEPVEIERISLHRYCYDGPQVGRFDSDDALLDRIHEVSVYTVRLCMQRDHYSDDIKRERTLWMGDMRPEAMVNSYAFGDRELLPANLAELGGSRQVRDFLEYQCWWGITLWDYWRFSGDLEYLRAQKANLEDAVAHLERFAVADGPVAGLIARDDAHPNWCMDRRRGCMVAQQALWVGLLRRGAELERALGDEATAAAWEVRAAAVAERVREVFWDEQAGAFLDAWHEGRIVRHYAQDGNALAVVFGIATPQQALRVSDFLAERLHCPIGSKVVWPDFPPGEGVITFISPFMTQFEVEAHFLAGRPQRALETIRLTWGHMLSKGATTFWEGYDMDGEIPRPGVSLCHGWSGGPGWLLPRYVLGVRPAEPGFATFEVDPQAGGLREIEGAVPTPAGRIRVRHLFGRDGDRYTGRLEWTGGGVALLAVPGSGRPDARVLVDERVVWENGGPTAEGRSLDARRDGGRVRLRLAGGGPYAIRCR